MTWKKIFELPGIIKTAQAFTAAMIAETGEDIYQIEDQAAFDRMVKDGWITYENGKTIAWQD